MKGSVFITTVTAFDTTPRWDDNGVHHHWIREDVDDETLSEELHDVYEGPSNKRVSRQGLTRMVSTTTGEIGYAYEGRLFRIFDSARWAHPGQPIRRSFNNRRMAPIVKKYI